MADPILTQDQAAKLCAAMRALDGISTYTSLMVRNEQGQTLRVYTTRTGAVHVDGPVLRGEPGPSRYERHASEAAFAEAYGQPTDGLLPF